MSHPTPTSAPPPQTRTTMPDGSAGSLRIPALVAGIGLLLMAFLASWAYFFVIEGLLADDSAARTAQNILAAETTVWLGVVSLLVVAILDVIVAWGLWAFFAPAHRSVSMLAAGFRVIYASVFTFAILRLVSAIRLVTDSPRSSGLSAQHLQLEALQRIDAFHLIWDIGYILFGLHLVLVGYLAYRSRYTPRLLGPLVAVAGVGWLVDSLGALLAPGTLPGFATLTFVGEVLLLAWLLIRGRHITVDAALRSRYHHHPDAEEAHHIPVPGQNGGARHEADEP